jgi:hypothetical protein
VGYQPIVNYDEIHIIFIGLATGKYAMGSKEALGTPLVALSVEDGDTHESDGLSGEGIPKNPTGASKRVYVGKRKMVHLLKTSSWSSPT